MFFPTPFQRLFFEDQNANLSAKVRLWVDFRFSWDPEIDPWGAIFGQKTSKCRVPRTTGSVLEDLVPKTSNDVFSLIRRPHRGQQAVRVLPVGSPWSPSVQVFSSGVPPPPPDAWFHKDPYFATLGPKYTTLGPKFYIFSVLSPRICFCFANPYFLAGIAAFVEILLLAVSKHVLKRS